MYYFLKSYFILSFLMFSSTFSAGPPASWDYVFGNKDMIEIQDSENNYLDLQFEDELPKGYSWYYDDSNNAVIVDPQGQVIGQMQLVECPDDYIFICYKDRIYFIPCRTQQIHEHNDLITPNSRYQKYSNTSLPFMQYSSTVLENRMQQSNGQVGHATLSDALYAVDRAPMAECLQCRAEQRQEHNDFIAQHSRYQQHSISSLPFIQYSSRVLENLMPRSNGQVGHVTIRDALRTAGFNPSHGTNTRYVEGFQSAVASTFEQESAQKAMESVGKKRVREEEITEPNPAKRIKPDLDPKTVAYWRINPLKEGEFQLCGKDDTVLYTKSVRIKGRSRKLSHGHLRIVLKGREFCCDRDSNDTADLEKNGFAEGSNHNVIVMARQSRFFL